MRMIGAGRFSDEIKANPQKRMAVLTEAITKGKVAEVKALIRLDTSLNHVLNCGDAFGQRPLHNAARYNQVETAMTLVQLGANINAGNLTFDTPLHVACKYGSTRTVAALLFLGAQVNARGSFSRTPLHYAAEEGHVECIELLMTHGANSFSKTSTELDYGNTALHVAAWCGQCKSIEALLSPKLLHGAEKLLTLRDRKNKEGNTALHLAALNGKTNTVDFLAAKGADMDAKGKNGRRAIHIAAVTGQADVVKFLLNRGAVITAKSGKNLPDFFQTPIHLAAYHGHMNVIDVLLEKEPRLINMRCHVQGQTPLHRAVANFQAEVVKGLIKRGAALDIKDDLGRTPATLIQTMRAGKGTFQQAQRRLVITKLLLGANNEKQDLPFLLLQPASARSQLSSRLSISIADSLSQNNETQSTYLADEDENNNNGRISPISSPTSSNFLPKINLLHSSTIS